MQKVKRRESAKEREREREREKKRGTRWQSREVTIKCKGTCTGA